MESVKHEADLDSAFCKLETAGEVKSLSSDVTSEKLSKFSQNICSIDYSSFPHVLFRALPWEIQRLIKNRIKHAKCPLFVLVTHKNGQWCIVQLNTCSEFDNLFTCNEINSDVSQKHSSKPISLISNKWISSLEVNLNSTTKAIFSEASVKFITTIACVAESWHCPFCSSCFSDREFYEKSVIRQHLRLHIELRCCVDCSTVLPNDWSLHDPVVNRLHVCSDFVKKASREHSGSNCFTISDSAIRLTDRPNMSVIDYKKWPNHSILSTSSDPVPYTTRSLDSNKLNHQSCSSNSDLTIGCFRCGIEFKKHVQYRRHMKNVHQDRQFLCPDCDASFSTKGNLTKHFTQVHNQNTRLVCHLCQKRLSNKFNLDRHYRFIHSNPVQSTSSTSDTVDSDKTLASQNNLPDSSTAHTNRSTSDSDLQSNVTQTWITSGLHHRNTNNTPPNTVPRGYYLYLSNKESEANNTENLHFIPEEAGSRNSAPVSLVAEVELTSCLPSSPDAQYGTGGTIWRPNVHIVDTNASLENT